MHAPADIHDFLEITKKYYLQSVRTYDHSPTFIGPQGSSSIDHILIHEAKLDAHGRLGRTLPEFPVASWRACRDHIPVICSVSLGWKCWFHKPPHKHTMTKHTKQALFEAWHNQSPVWHQLQDSLSQGMHAIPSQLTHLPALKHQLLSQCHNVLRTPSTDLGVPAPKHKSIIAQLWHSYGIVRRTQTTSIAALFEAWKHASRLQILKKRLSASCRHAKANRLHQAVADAHNAALRHDTRTVFAVIRRITPRQPYRAIRLRGSQGEALPAFEEGQLLAEHFQTVFQSTSYCPPSNAGQLTYLPFTFDALVNAFHKAPITKAVGPSSLPNLMLRLLAEPLAEWLWPALTHAWCMQTDPSIPQDWKDALGIKISFHHFEDYTLKYCLHIGRIAFLRLRPWLLKRHSYPLALRLQLWQTCIRSSCLHGLQATGLTTSGLQKLHRHLIADLRRIARSPSHITHESTIDLLQRLHLPLPIVHLQEHWQQQYERLHLRWQGLPLGTSF